MGPHSLLRLALLGLVVAAVLLPAPRERSERAEAVLRSSGAAGQEMRPSLTGPPPGLVARISSSPPTNSELDVLAALARRSALVITLPERAPAVSARAPEWARAGRAAAIHFTVHGRPGDTATVRLHDGAGLLDSVRIAFDRSGTARGAFRLEPERAGWHDWFVASGNDRAPAGAWVRAAAPLRVLVAAGPPDWETRFVARALEESGALVTFAQPLGRGLSARGALTRLPVAAGALSPYDVVIVLPGAATPAAALDALRDYTSRLGGGVLVGVHAQAAPTIGMTSVATAGEVMSADGLRWSLPAEIVPLPTVPVELRVHFLQPLAALATPVGHAPSGATLVLSPLGGGRVGVLGIADTWRWRMEAGRVEEHRAFWRSLVDWLAAGARDTVSMRIAEANPATGIPIPVAVDHAGTPIDQVTVQRPDGTAESLPLAQTQSSGGGGASNTALLAATPGVHELRVAGRSTLAAFAAAEPSNEGPVSGDSWARLTLLAYASGGRATTAGSIDDVIAEWRQANSRATSPDTRPILFFTLIAGLALTEWTVRRLRGMR